MWKAPGSPWENRGQGTAWTSSGRLAAVKTSRPATCGEEMKVIRISVDNACSFARSMDEELSSPEQFFAATSEWLKENQPVLAELSRAMAVRLCGDDTAAAATQAVVGYTIRLLSHAEANQSLGCQWGDEKCPHVQFPLGEPEPGHRKYCCHKKEASLACPHG